MNHRSCADVARVWYDSRRAGSEMETIEFTAVDITARVDLNRGWHYRCHELLVCCGNFRFVSD